MKKLLIALLILGLPIAVLAGHMATQAAQEDHFQRDEAAASFSSTDGCIRTDVDVFVIAGADRHAANPGNARNDGHVTLNQVDTCAGHEVMHAEGHTALNASNIKFDPNVNSAMLNATVPLTEEDSGATFNVDVTVSWTGRGGMQHANAPVRVPGARNTIPTAIQGRTSTASGKVTRDGTNLTPGSSTFARIGQVRDSASSGS